MKLKGYIGDAPKDLRLQLFADADFASDLTTRKSTIGLFLALAGPHSFFPLTAVSKKQSAVSHSTPEAEIIAADTALRTLGLPGMDLWDKVMKKLLNEKAMPVKFMEDNESTISIIESGKNHTMRHIQRTHDVSVKWLSETFKKLKKRLRLVNCDTNEQSADIFKKAFDDTEKLLKVCKLIGLGGFRPLTTDRIPKVRGVDTPEKLTKGQRRFQNDESKLQNDDSKPSGTIEPPHSRRCHCPVCTSCANKTEIKPDDTDWSKYDRVIIEYCCYEDSLMRKRTPESRGCKVIRVTSSHDQTTEEGVKWLLNEIKRIPNRIPILLWGYTVYWGNAMGTGFIGLTSEGGAKNNCFGNSRLQNRFCIKE